MQQIDYLTSTIDLNAEEAERGGSANPPSDSSSSSGSSSSKVTVGSIHRRPSEPSEPGTSDSSGSLRRGHHSGSQSPPNVLLCPVTSGFPSERSQTLRFPCSLGSSPRHGGPLQLDVPLSPQRSHPGRPPTPGLSPLTVNLHHLNSPGSHSPGPSSSIRVSPLSPKSYPPPTLSPSVIIENNIGTYRTPQSGHPSASLVPPSPAQPPSASGPPTGSTQTVSNAETERPVSSPGSAHTPSQVCAAPAATAKPKATAAGRRGRKPPPYPHQGSSEHTKKVKEPRKAPPYPEKRRLLSTTV